MRISCACQDPSVGSRQTGPGLSYKCKLASSSWNKKKFEGEMLRLITCGVLAAPSCFVFFGSRARLSRLLRLNNDLTVFSRVVSHELSILSYCCLKRLAGAVFFIISNANYCGSFFTHFEEKISSFLIPRIKSPTWKRNFFAHNLTFSNFFKMSLPEFGSFQKSADKEIKIQIAVTFKSCVGSTGDILIWKKKRLHLRFETLKFGLASQNWRRHCDVEGGCHCWPLTGQGKERDININC